MSDSESSDDRPLSSRELMDIWEAAGDDWLNGVKFVVRLLVPELLPFLLIISALKCCCKSELDFTALTSQTSEPNTSTVPAFKIFSAQSIPSTLSDSLKKSDCIPKSNHLSQLAC